jgi:hypothetical protein
MNAFFWYSLGVAHGYLWTGQSNSTGTNSTDHLPVEFSGLREGQQVFIDEWEQLEAGVNNAGKDPTLTYPNRFGSELFFSQLLYEWINETICLIKFSRGGVQLAPKVGELNDWSPQSVNDFFDRQQEHYLAAVAAYPGTLRIMFDVWWQGENDAGIGQTQAQYRENQSELILTRRSLNNYSIPFIDVSLSTGQTALNSVNRAAINAAKYDLAENVYDAATQTMTQKTGEYVIPNTWYIIQNEACNTIYENDDGSNGGSDNVHYTPEGHENIAHYIFEVVTHSIFVMG